MNETGREYLIGSIGPAGGIVFYDKGSYVDGWRYLEAAPTDLGLERGKPSISGDSGSKDFIFGLNGEDDSDLFVNGTTTYNASTCTGTKIGAGKRNTSLLVDAMKDSAGVWVWDEHHYEDVYCREKEYAAKLCLNLSHNGFNDWYLPSKDELSLIYTNLFQAGIGEFSDYYWSSSESQAEPLNAWAQSFKDGDSYEELRISCCRVRPIRDF